MDAVAQQDPLTAQAYAHIAHGNVLAGGVHQRAVDVQFLDGEVHIVQAHHLVLSSAISSNRSSPRSSSNSAIPSAARRPAISS